MWSLVQWCTRQSAQFHSYSKTWQRPFRTVKSSAIALTNCVCKTMERMTNARLVWFLESNGILSNVQIGFRRGRNTLDHPVRFEAFIWSALPKKEHDVSIFFDLQKVYDTKWKYGILKDLFDMRLKSVKEVTSNCIYL